MSVNGYDAAMTRLLLLLPLLVVLLACDGGGEPVTKGEPAAVTLQLNWFPEPQFGGFYEAERNGAFAERRLDVTVRAGGPDLSPVQIVAAGGAEFGLCSADELLIARSRGADVVALFATFQTNPQGLMMRSDDSVESIAALFERGGIIAWQSGLPYVTYLKERHGDKGTFVEERPSPGGDLTSLRRDDDYAMQVFVTSEPITAAREGLEVKTLLVADSGYNPYAAVLICRQQYLKENPDVCQRMVEAARAGWASYLQDPTATNARMQAENATMPAEAFAAAAEAQKPLIESDPIGAMSEERWRTLAAQLVEIGELEDETAAEGAFAVFGSE